MKDVETVTYPLADDDHPAGMSMLTSMPPTDLMFEPDSFNKGSRSVLNAVVAKCKNMFKNWPSVVQEWEDFAALCPVDDDAQLYCSTHPLDIPLKVCMNVGLQLLQLIHCSQEILFNNAERNEGVAVPARERRVREAVVAADSVVYRRAGRQAAATPYVSSISVAPVNPNISIQADDSDSSDNEDNIIQYQDIQPGEQVSSTESIDRYLEFIGRTFKDIDEDIDFRVVSVCKEIPDTRGRRTYNGMCFRYQHVKAPTEFEYTPCQELLNSTWCRWNTTSSASARENRASGRHNSTVPGKRGKVASKTKSNEPPSRTLRSRYTKRKRADEDDHSDDSES